MTTFRHVLLFSAALPSAGMTQAFQSHDAIDASVATALVGTGLAARPVDRRLKLAACAAPLSVASPAAGTVAVQCAAGGWRLRVLLDGPPATVTMLPIIIKKGDPVAVDLVAPGFSVSTSGVADSDAFRGARVRVRVAEKGGAIVGEAIDPGVVRVNAFNKF